MKYFIIILIWALLIPSGIYAAEFNGKEFANTYFNAWIATQSPKATKKDIEKYLSLLTADVGHQHLPYDPDDARHPDGKNKMKKGMSYYLGSHTEYTGTLINITVGYGVVVIEYDTLSKGVHPQTKEIITQKYRTLEVLEFEDSKVSVIRKYSE